MAVSGNKNKDKDKDTCYEAFDEEDIEEDLDESSEATPRIQENFDPFAESRRPKVIDRENDYQSRWRKRVLSPAKHDPFSGEATPDANSGVRTYAHALKERQLEGERRALNDQLKNKIKEGTLTIIPGGSADKQTSKKRRWDQAVDETPAPKVKAVGRDEVATPFLSKWGETPAVHRGDETPGSSQKSWDATPRAETPGQSQQSTPSVRASRWDKTSKSEEETPIHAGSIVDTPSTVDHVQRKRSRWDETPAGATPGATPCADTPGGKTPGASGGKTPVLFLPSATPVGDKAMGMATPAFSMTPDQKRILNLRRELDELNRPVTDEELDAILPQQGYKILQPPKGYVPLTSSKLTATPTPVSASQFGFAMLAPDARTRCMDVQPADASLPTLKEEDVQHFGELLEEEEGEEGGEEDSKRRILKLILKIKNGTPPMRKSAMRQMTDKAVEFGAGPLMDAILPLLMNPSLEDHERHYLVKLLERLFYKLDDLVRPHIERILIVVEPLLMVEQHYSRVEGREIISSLAKAVGFAPIIKVLRLGLDNMDEYVRNVTAKCFAVITSTFGVQAVLPFLKAACKSKKSWQARHTGIKCIQQIAILIGCAVVPHLKSFVETVEHGLIDENQMVRTISALAISALAEAATPYGIEAFDSVLKVLWQGVRKYRGKGLAAFLKAIGHLIPLMDEEFSSYYTKEVMLVVRREFSSPDMEMKLIILKVVKQCCSAQGVEGAYVRAEVLEPFFKCFWSPLMSDDKRAYRQLVDTTVEIAGKAGVSEVVGRIVENLKDMSERYRKMVLETIEQTMLNHGASDIDERLEQLIVDGVMCAYQEQTMSDPSILTSVASVINILDSRIRPYIPQIHGIIRFSLSNKNAKVREQAADLMSKIAHVMMKCNQEAILISLGQLFYENLGEEYPEVLGSILAATKSIVSVVGMTKMNPPVKDLLTRLTPILKNRHEKVQENCIELVGRIADRGAEYVAPREWMRICFELLELLKAHKKSIRRASVNTFGYIAKAIGPNDVLATLLNNLKVQERQNRVCTTVAIAIVAETCSPFTVLPALMNEYRVPEMNVQNGVLKSMSFLFEYVGEMSKDYVYAIVPLLEDALVDRDHVHRQTAMSAIGHIAIGVHGLGCNDAMAHLMNFVWPNILETSLHVQQAFLHAIEGLRVALGPVVILQHLVQGLYHPARKVREAYWRVYNMVYVGSQPALVAGYPRVCNDKDNEYVMYELEYHF